MQEHPLYEFPLNERMRNFMRLENCFLQICYFQTKTTWDSQASLVTLVEILNILERTDIRSEILKELERNIGNLSRLLNTPSVNKEKLLETLTKLKGQVSAMQTLTGKLTRVLRQDELLNAIKQRLAITTHANRFDIPGYYHWLHQPTEVRQQRIDQWLRELQPIKESIDLLLMLTRECACFATKTAIRGFYQQSFDTQQVCQMVRIHLPLETKCFPEVSGSKHRITLRLMSYLNPLERPTQIEDTIEFDLSCCTL